MLHSLKKLVRRWPGVQNKRWFATVWLVVTTLFLGLILLALHTRNSDIVKATAVAEDFIIAMQSDDSDSAYALGGTAFRQSITEEKLGQTFDQVGPYLRQASIELTDRQVPADTNKGSKIVVVYVASRTKSTAYLRLTLVRESDEWRVYALRTAVEPLSAKQSD